MRRVVEEVVEAARVADGRALGTLDDVRSGAQQRRFDLVLRSRIHPFEGSELAYHQAGRLNRKVNGYVASVNWLEERIREAPCAARATNGKDRRREVPRRERVLLPCWNCCDERPGKASNSRAQVAGIARAAEVLGELVHHPSEQRHVQRVTR